MNDKDWKALLNKLDTHEAPDQLNRDVLNSNSDHGWAALLNQLSEEKAPEIELKIQKEAKLVTVFKSTPVWLKIAASLLIIVFAWVIWPDKNTDSSIVLTKQVAEPTILNGSIEEAALSLDEFCAAYEIKCDQEELGQFRVEWEEVSTAILSVLESLENNQNDEFLLRQLSTLEARHSELVNELLKIVWS